LQPDAQKDHAPLKRSVSSHSHYGVMIIKCKFAKASNHIKPRFYLGKHSKEWRKVVIVAPQ
jgi:hypothetical protein